MTPKRTSSSNRLLVLLLLLSAPFVARAAEFTQTICRDGAEIGLTQIPSGQTWNPAPITIYEQFFGLPMTGAVRDVYIVGALKINERLRKAYTDNWQLEVVYDIKLYDNSNILLQTITGEKLAVNYYQEGTYDDYTEKIYRSALNFRKAVVTITQINAQQLNNAGLVINNGTLSSLDGSMFTDVSLEWRCTSVRSFEMGTVNAPAINHSSDTQVNLSPVCSGNTPDNIMRLGWTYLAGAESYDVEWLFLDIPPTYNSGNNTYTLPSATQSFAIDWRRATRVNVTGNFYDVPLLYPTGVVVYRVRGVGVDVNNNFVRLEGKWSREPSGGGYLDNLANITNSDRFVYCGLETGHNWTATLSFAEEGKSKGVVSFVDGTGRTRQTITTLSTDENTIVAEPSLDNMGRPSVQFLPVAVRGEQFKFYPAFNDGHEASVFDIPTALPNNAPVPGLTGTTAAANEFYSGNNPFLSSNGTPYGDYLKRLTGYLPDAENYPFSQTRMMNDGSGRAHSSSGVGGKHMLGGGHDTRYYYATPGAQAELDRLFGSEVGFVSYYTKNMVIDPNGQISLAYVDGYGRTVATALAGSNTDDMLQSINNSTPPSIASNLLDNNALLNNGTLTASKDFLVAVDGQYDFSYSVSQTEFESLCSGNYDCKLEFLITVKTDEGIEKILPTPVWQDVSTTTFPYTFSLQLQTGKYTVTKSLRVIETEYQQILANVDATLGNDWRTTTNACFTPPFVSGCVSCENQCENAYRYEYVLEGQPHWIYRNLGTSPGLDYTIDPNVAAVTDGAGNPVFTLIASNNAIVTGAEIAITDCKALCGAIPEVNTNTECEMKRILLIRDLMPGGQYFENRPKDPSVSGLANPDYITGADNDPDSRNAWLEAYVSDLKGNFGALLNPANTGASWNQIRSGWSTINTNAPAFQTLKDQLITRHPEYCLWNAFCGSGDDSCDCKTGVQPAFYGTPNHYADVMANTITDNDAADGQLFMPTGHTPIIQGYNTGPFNPSYYLPELEPDPCKKDPLLFCHPELAGTIYNMLAKYMTVTVGSTPVDISIWYLIDDPENLRAHDLTLGSHPTYPDPFVQYIQILHGSPTNVSGGVLSPGNPNAITKWQYFRNVYGFMRMSAQYNLAAADAQRCMEESGTHPLGPDLSSCGTGVACEMLPFFSAWDNDNDGLMDIGTGTNSFPFDGMEIRYPYINLFSGASVAADYCETNCSALATQWISQLETGIRGCATVATDPNTGNPITPAFQIPAADKLILRDYFTNICEKSCAAQNAASVYTHDYSSYPAMVASDWIGPEYVFGPYFNGSTVISNVNDVVTRYAELYTTVEGCPILINSIPASSGQPSPDPNMLNCSCQGLADLIFENNGLKAPYKQINPVKWGLMGVSAGSVFDMAQIRQTLLDVETLPPAYATLIQGLTANQFRDLVLHWLNACDQNAAGIIPTFVDGSTQIDFPEFLACEPDTLPGEMDCAALDAEQEENVNSAAFNQFKQAQLSLFATQYKTSCLQYAQPTEIFTMSYDLSEYHYTLYYYDQAGNLVKTVPPEGVSIITSNTTLTAIDAFRKSSHHTATYADQPSFVRPPHTKVSNYVFNGQNQVIEQTSPDGGKSVFYYDALGRLVASQNAQQEKDDVHSYTLYDARGRVLEVGQTELLAFYTVGDRKKNQKYIEQFPPAVGDLTPFEDDLANNESYKSQITKTFYDEPVLFQWGIPAAAFPQVNLRNRVVTAVYYAVFPNNGWAYYDNATHYTYDIHGNVNRLAQDIPALQPAKRRFLYTDYVYDLISGNVNEVHYMKGFSEQFSHYYRYDADNRLTITRTSKNGGLVKELEAKYFYYPTGSLARTELGRAQVQGMDYAHSVHGWTKGVNTDEINTVADIGKDANYSTTNLHTLFGVDAAGYTLGYYHGDYMGIGSPDAFEADVTQGDDMATAMHPATSALADWGLYNGNIAKMVAAGLDCEEKLMDVLGRSFMYDQLNRIITSTSFTRNNQIDFQNNLSSFTWNGIGNANKWDTHYTYDADGNIQKLSRLDDVGNTMDDLTYYYTAGKNRLEYVDDGIIASSQPDDMEAQGLNNYKYDNIGNLQKDASEDIDNIAWNVYGKINYIRRLSGSPKPHLWFGYNPTGQRIVKVNKAYDLANPEKGYAATFYALDAQGNALAIYELKEDPESAKYDLFCSDQMIYGSSRVGMLHRDQRICADCKVDISALENSRNATAPPQSYAAPMAMNGTATPKTVLGTREYEFNNHLGNVLATVADRKVFSPETDVMGSGNNALVFQYRPEVLTSGDYYPFGAPLPVRGCSKPIGCVTTSVIIEEWVYTYPFVDDVMPVLHPAMVYNTTYVEVTTQNPEEGAAFVFMADEGSHQIEFDVDIMSMSGGAKLGVSVMGYDPVTGDYTDPVAEIGEVLDMTKSIDFYSNATRNYKIIIKQIGTGSIRFWWKEFRVKKIREEFVRNCNTNPCNNCPNEYRYGFNGQEKDNEVAGEGNTYTAEFWEYDARLGRRWNVDPVVKPWESPYACFANNPIWYNDVKGLDASEAGDKGKGKAPKVDNTPPKMEGYIGEETTVEAKRTFWDKTKNFFKGVGNSIYNGLEDSENRLKRAFKNIKNVWDNIIFWGTGEKDNKNGVNPQTLKGPIYTVDLAEFAETISVLTQGPLGGGAEDARDKSKDIADEEGDSMGELIDLRNDDETEQPATKDKDTAYLRPLQGVAGRVLITVDKKDFQKNGDGAVMKKIVFVK